MTRAKVIIKNQVTLKTVSVTNIKIAKNLLKVKMFRCVIFRCVNLMLSNGNKDSSVVVTNRTYSNIMQKMIDGGIKKKIYEQSVSNQPAKLYGTANTHEFENLEDITPQKLKCRPIIDQMGTFTYEAAKVISSYLKP